MCSNVFTGVMEAEFPKHRRGSQRLPTVPGPRVRQSIYRGKCSTHDFQAQARNISQQSVEGALTWVYPLQALTGLKKKKVHNMQTGTFLA